MADIDKLQIEIKGSAKSADKSIETLIKRLSELEKSVSRISNSGSLPKMNKHIKAISSGKTIKINVNSKNAVKNLNDVTKKAKEATKALTGLNGAGKNVRAQKINIGGDAWKKLNPMGRSGGASVSGAKYKSLGPSKQYDSAEIEKFINEFSDGKQKARRKVASKDATPKVKSASYLGKENEEVKELDKSYRDLLRSKAKALKGNFASGFKSFGKILDGISKKLKNSTKGLSRFGNMLKMQAQFMIFGKIMGAMFKEMQDGFNNLAIWSNKNGTEFNKNLSSIVSNLSLVGRSIATAFEPLLNVATPIINAFLGKIVQLSNSLAQLFSALTGSKTWTKATQNVKNYGASIDKAKGSQKDLNKTLLGFDEINKLNDDTKGSSGSSDAGAGGDANAFETKDVSNKFQELAKKIKEAWEKGDFSGLGASLAEKVNESLKKIPWNKIQKTAKKVAKSIATFINGFVKTTDWSLVGSTIANALNTLIMSANTFLKTVDWKELGKAIADSINGFFKTFNFSELGETIANLINAACDLVVGFFDEVKFTDIAKGIKDLLKGCLKNLDYSDLAKVLGTVLGVKLLTSGAVTGALKTGGKGIFTKLGTIIRVNGPKWAKTLGTKIIDVIKLAATKLPALVSKLGSALSTFASTLFGQITICIATAIGGWKLGNWLYDKNVFGVGGAIDKIVEKSGIGKLVTKIADFFQFEFPDMAGKAAAWALALTNALLEKIPDGIKKFLGLDKVQENLKAKIEVEADTSSAEEDIKKATTSKKVKVTPDSTGFNTAIKNIKINPVKVNSVFTVNDKSFNNLKQLTVDIAASFSSGKKTSYTFKDAYGKAHTIYKKDGGIFSGGRWHPVKQYANGGMPDKGQYFIARESGPELVGNIGNKTAVLNNNQIVSSVASGVAISVANVMSPMIAQITSAVSNGGGNVYIDGKLITDAILQQAHNRKITNGGKNVFMTI